MQQEELKKESFDGTILRIVKTIPETSNGVVIIVHGLAEHLGRYEELTNALNANQLAVYRFDHRGHGKSAGKRAYYDDFNELVEDVHFIYEFVHQEYPMLPIFILGHSMGGFATACFGTKYPQKASGLILSGALTRDNYSRLQNIPAELPSTQYISNDLSDLTCTDKAVVEAYKADPLVLNQVSIGLIRALSMGVQWLKEHKKQFVDPVLVLHGCGDQLVSEKDSRDFFSDIASTDKELKIYAKLYHEILNEPCQHEIVHEIIFWIKQRL